MRRFEFVEGTSAKFWMAGVEGTTFTVVFGRLGTDGQRKEKAFPSEDAARKELEKKINEKLREGYREVAAGGASGGPPSSGGAGSSAPAKGAKGAAAASPRLPLPPRFAPVDLRGEDGAKRIASAVTALGRLREGLVRKHRSYVVGMLARRARRALGGIAGADPSAHRDLGAAVDAVMAQVTAPSSSRLPLRLALPLLLELDASAFTRALSRWQGVSAAPPAVALFAAQLETLADPELTLRFCALLGARPDRDESPEAAWAHGWRALKPHLEAQLVASGSTLKAHATLLATLPPSSADRALSQRIQRLR